MHQRNVSEHFTDIVKRQSKASCMLKLNVNGCETDIPWQFRCNGFPGNKYDALKPFIQIKNVRRKVS